MNPVATRDVWLIRHGETEWTVSRRHTGLTDLPLTKAGEDQARSLRNCLQRACFERVFCSPLQRAARTCELSGYGSVAEVDLDLVEWNYGDYEGEQRPHILAERPPGLFFGTVVPMVNHQGRRRPSRSISFPHSNNTGKRRCLLKRSFSKGIDCSVARSGTFCRSIFQTRDSDCYRPRIRS